MAINLSLQKNLKPPYDFEAYAAPSLPVGECLERQAAEAERTGNIIKATELYLRAACVYRIGRFPFLLTATKGLQGRDKSLCFLRSHVSPH